jgi:predicted PhzF superfamily epimerase YddE/YHI9
VKATASCAPSSPSTVGRRGSGTGSACANLGGWLLATGAPLPQRLTIDQGEAVGRPCHLLLEVTAERQIRVCGRVIEIAQGTVTL